MSRELCGLTTIPYQDLYQKLKNFTAYSRVRVVHNEGGGVFYELVFRCVRTSVVDPNTLNLDPDPEFRPNLDLDPGLGYQFKIILKKDNLLQKHIFCLTIGA